ncbi:Glycogenin-1 [Nymphon striatum]|nr:Glycogenin-1 [Nymphon striatum]
MDVSPTFQSLSEHKLFPMNLIEDQAYVTLATNDSYALGALVAAHSLKNVKTTRKLVILITPGVTPPMRAQLSCVFDLVNDVDVFDSKDSANLALMARPELGVTFTKLHCWRLTQFTKCVFMDADMLVLQNCDELFDREEFSAVADVGWPDCFNSGLFVFRPSLDTFNALVQFAITNGSFDGGDQGLLNMYFSNWSSKDIAKHIPFVYNMVSATTYSYLPAYQKFQNNVKIVHFLGSFKPWMHNFNKETGKVERSQSTVHGLSHLQIWWNIFIEKVQPLLEPKCSGIAGLLSQMEISASATDSTPATGSDDKTSIEKAIKDHTRQLAWERGQMDYMGEDSFDNIQKKLDSAIGKK